MTKQLSSLQRGIIIPNTLRVLICFMLLRACGTTISFSDIDMATYTLDSLTKGFKISGTTNNLGSSISTGGDIDNDGFPDLLIGGSGEVTVIYGRGRTSIPSNNLVTTTLDPATTGFKITGGSSYFGSSVSFAGDVNGDGVDDMIIGDSNGGYEGNAYVIYGKKERSSLASINLGSLNPATTGFVINGPPSYIGVYPTGAVSTVGDINKDGYSDIIVGATGDTGVGIAYVIYGGKNLAMQHIFLEITPLDPQTTGFKITSRFASLFYDINLSTRPVDIDKDGYNDIIFASLDTTVSGDYTTEVYVIYGREKSATSNIDLASGLNPSTTGFKLSKGASYHGLGECALSTAGDIDNDGYDDIILGVSIADGRGAAYVLYGGGRSSRSNIDLSTTLNPLTTGFVIKGHTSSWLGTSVSIAADINKDGYDDIIIGVGGTYMSATKGAVYVMYGGDRSNLFNFDFLTRVLDPTLTGFIIKGKANDDYFGRSIASADFDNDGYDELIIGASSTIGVHVLYGKIFFFSPKI